jgi:hypothetical protein
MMMRLGLLVSFLTAASGALAQGQAAEITLDGRAASCIVVPAKATSTERFAAGELQAYLQRISGVKLPIAPEGSGAQSVRLLVGATAAATETRQALAGDDPESFVVRTVRGDLLLSGATDRATLYAVYDFLEQELGCRWLGPGPDWEVIPKNSTIGLPRVDRTETPAMRYRFLRMTVIAEPGTWSDHAMSWSIMALNTDKSPCVQASISDYWTRRLHPRYS